MGEGNLFNSLLHDNKSDVIWCTKSTIEKRTMCQLIMSPIVVYTKNDWLHLPAGSLRGGVKIEPANIIINT